MKENMISNVYYKVLFIYFFQSINCLITNPAIGILTESNIYLAKIPEFTSSYDEEFNSTYDDLHLIYHHQDPVYPLQSFTSDLHLHRIYVCSPSLLYTLELQIEATIVPLSPIDDTPCRTSLTYLSNDSTLIWTLRHAIIELDVEDMSREFLWNSPSVIIDMIHNNTIDNDDIEIFYLSINITDHQSSVLRCRTDHRARHINPFGTCLFIASGFHEVTALAIHGNHLYVADRIEKRIYILTVSLSGFVTKKEILPLNTSTVADIKSMFIHHDYLIWLTTSGHVRIVLLSTLQVRTIFWFDEQLRTIRLVSFAEWPNRTTTTTITTNEPDTTTDINDSSPWQATTYVTSVILGVALFLCAVMITCVLLNYRLGRAVPNSFTNIFHILRNRPTSPEDTSLTLSVS